MMVRLGCHIHEMRSSRSPKPTQETREPTLGENSTSDGATTVMSEPLGSGLSSVILKV